MKIAVMQPYLFPYLGYFQLAASVDRFVFFDDVNFIKKGYIHRNSIVVNGELNRFSLPLKKASQNVLIKDVWVADTFEDWKVKFIKTLEINYSKAPYFSEVMGLLKPVLKKDNLSELAIESVLSVFQYLNKDLNCLKSSSLDYTRSGSGQDKILSICNVIGASSYYNAIGGMELYNPVDFNRSDLNLIFVKMKPNLSDAYFDGQTANASILHLLFHFSPEVLTKVLTSYELISPNELET